MNLQRMLKYLSLAFSLGFLWEQLRTVKATDPATRTEDHSGVAALVLSQPRAQAAPRPRNIACTSQGEMTMMMGFWDKARHWLVQQALGQERANRRVMAEALGMYMPSEADEIAVQFAKAEKVVSKAHGTTKSGGGVGGRRMGQPRSRLPTSSKPAPSPKPASSPKRERPKKRSPEQELERKRTTINRQYKIGCVLAVIGGAGSGDDNAAAKQREALAKARDYELWEAQVEYDRATGKATAGPRPPVPYPDPPPQLTTPPSPRDWLGRR